MGIEYSSLYLDETYRFHVVWAKSAGTIFRTQIPSPENFAEYTFSVFINGLELNEQDYKAYSWNDNGTYRVVIELLNGLQFNVDDFIVVWVRTRLDVNDVDFAEGQRLSAQKLKTIFVRILQKLEELKSAGFAFASPLVLMQLAKNVADIAPQLAAAAEADVDAYVDTVSKPEIDAYWDNLANSTTLDADTLDGLHATDFVQQDSAGNVSITGTLDVAGDTTVKGINVLKAFPPAIPEGSTAYFKKQLIDEIIGIKPDGYDGSTVTSYGLRTSSDNATLVVTERKDDVPFPGVTSFAVEEGTTNILPNPSFEEWSGDMPTNWVKGSNVTIEQVPGRRPNSYAVRFSSSSGGNAVTNRLTSASGIIQPNTTYTISFYARRISGEGSLGIAIDGTGVFYPTQGIDNRWQRFSVTLTTTSNTYTSFGFFPTQANDVFEIDDVQVEQKPFATSFVDGTRPHGIVKLTPPLPLDNFVINLWFKPTRYPAQNGLWWHLFNVSYNASALQGLELVAPPSAHSGIPANTLSLTVRNSETIFTRYNLGFDLSAEIGKWHMITLISNGNTVDVYIDGEKRVSATNDIQRSAIEFIVFGRFFAYISGTAQENGFLMSNLLFASYDPAIWTDEYIRFLYETQKPFFV